MDAANPLGVGGISYLCLLSLQTQEVRALHEVPWGQLVLSGLWVLPCRDLLKVGGSVSQLGSRAIAHRQPLLSRTMPQGLF